MNDDPALADLTHRLTNARDSLGGERMTIAASEIIARDKRRRARRWLAAGGSAGAATALAVALTLSMGSSPRAAGSSARVAQGHAQLAAWTVRTNPDRTVTFTLRNTSRPAQLQRALAKAGVPAVVRWGEICQAQWVHGQPLISTVGFLTGNNAFTQDTASFFAANGGPGVMLDLDWSWTVIPSKIPRGGHFVISAEPGPVPVNDYQAVWEFARTSAPITCAKRVDN
jgi:hypothetical protein